MPQLNFLSFFFEFVFFTMFLILFFFNTNLEML